MSNWGPPPAWAQQPPSQQWYAAPPGGHPHVYMPPQNVGYWPQAGYRPPVDLQHNEYRSFKYPNLNPILAADTTLIRFNVQGKPGTEILSSTFYSNRGSPAFSQAVYQLRLISKFFPWAIEIKLPHTSSVTCEMIWDAIYSALQEPIADSEWGLICGASTKDGIRADIEKAAKKRIEATKDKKGLKRIDYLCEKVMFKGLEKDDDFERLRLPPGGEKVNETWLIKFDKP